MKSCGVWLVCRRCGRVSAIVICAFLEVYVGSQLNGIWTLEGCAR